VRRLKIICLNAWPSFFNRLPHEGKLAFVLRVLLPKGYEAQRAAQVMNPTNIRIETQYPIPNGLLDLIVLADGQSYGSQFGVTLEPLERSTNRANCSTSRTSAYKAELTFEHGECPLIACRARGECPKVGAI
jgi:hypothetical protein